MIANAIGPQNTVGAIGIRPSTVDIAASIIGRSRLVAEVSTASRTLRPAARSSSAGCSRPAGSARWARCWT